jgi:hypothetical protein
MYFNSSVKIEYDDSDNEKYHKEQQQQHQHQQANRGGRKQVKQGTTKRNARERNRVRYINNCFDSLREHIPCVMASSSTSPARKLSKVETLKYATAYIRQLTLALQESIDDNSHELDEQMDQQSLLPTTNCQVQRLNDTTNNMSKTNYYQNIMLNNINININDCNHYYHGINHEYNSQYETHESYMDQHCDHYPHHHHQQQQPPQQQYFCDLNGYTSPSASVRTSSSSCSSSYSPTSMQSPLYFGKW